MLNTRSIEVRPGDGDPHRGASGPRFILFSFIGLAQHWFQDRDHFINDFGTEGLPDDLDKAYLEAMSKIFFEGTLTR